jgi:hypothetical protein
MWRGARCRVRSCPRAGSSFNCRSGAAEVVAFVPEVVALASELEALPGRFVRYPELFRMVAINEGPLLLTAIAEAIGKDLVETDGCARARGWETASRGAADPGPPRSRGHGPRWG